MRTLHQQTPDVPVTAFADGQVRILLAALPALWNQFQKRSHITTMRKPFRLPYGQHEGERGQRSDARHLPKPAGSTGFMVGCSRLVSSHARVSIGRPCLPEIGGHDLAGAGRSSVYSSFRMD
jgi:hypothetical protein